MTPDHSIFVGIFEGFTWIRCEGKGSFVSSPALKTCGEARIDAGERYLVVDLAACTGMDSTFMGTLAGLSNKLKKARGRFQVADPGVKNRSSLDDLGLGYVLEIDPPDAIWQPHLAEVRAHLQPFTDVRSLGMVDRAKHVLDAHKILSEINDENARKFEGVVGLLEQELAKQPPEAAGAPPATDAAETDKHLRKPAKRNERNSTRTITSNPAMDLTHVFLLAVCALVVAIVWRTHATRLAAARKELDKIQGEESRMFDYLHELGCTIGADTSLKKLYRMIVDGIDRVVTAKGGALYLISEDGTYLVPQYMSEQCPPLIGVPVEILKKAERDPRALESHLRLARVLVDEGILGHCLSVGEAVHVQEVKNHPAFRDAFIRYEGDVAALVAPLRHAGKDLGVLAVARSPDGGIFTDNDFAVFRSVAEQSSFAIGNARIYREAHEKRAMESELRTAREVQRVLLPGTGPIVAGYRIAGNNLPARIISGDYYDFIDLGGGRHGVVIADVSGKGVPAGLLMAMCRSVLRSIAPGEPSPARALAAVNRQLFEDIREDMFISMIYLIIDGEDGRVTMARAGHDAAFCYRKASGTVEAIKPPGLALGVDGGDVFERVTRDHEVILGSGDCMLLFTDGVKEAVDGKEEEFGMERVSGVFRGSAPLGAEASLEAVYREVKAFTGESPQMDDITLVAIEKR